MNSVGETLRRARLRAGFDLEKLAQETKISIRMLEMIEADQFQKLPGSVFARSFVRQFARAVGLDEEETLRGLEQKLAPNPVPLPSTQDIARHEIKLPRVPSSRGPGSFRSNSLLPSLALVVLVMLLCSAAYNLWQKSRHSSSPARTPEQVQQKVAEAPPPVTAPAQHADAALPSAAVTVTSTDGAGGLRINLTAEEATWVRATANGKVVFAGTIQAKETKALSAADTVTLRLGNAGGVSISLNGKEIPAVGPRGQVRDVRLSVDGGVQVVPPVKPPSTQSL